MSRITAHLSRRVLLVGGAVWLAILLYMFGGSHILPVLASRLTWNDPQEPSYEGLLPPIFNPHLPGQPPQEFDDEGGCLFLSPFDALSEEEKALARGTVLDEAAPGVVRVNVSSTGEQTHPIPALLLAGEQRWKKLLATQSTTLEEAARTYEERWGRPPPKGFDGWWQFASERSPLLVDEFDSIMQTLLPFYGLSVEEIQQRAKEAEGVVETFTLIVANSTVELKYYDESYAGTFWAGRANAQVRLIEPYVDRLEPFRATFSVHDQPSVAVPFTEMSDLWDAAKKRTTIETSDTSDTVDAFERNYDTLCAPDSALATGKMDFPQTFVSNHLAAMNPCDHPSILENHGMFLEERDKNSRPVVHNRLLPIFALSSTQIHADILVTPVGQEGQVIHGGEPVEWSSKSDKVYWRGQTTGMWHDKGRGRKWRHSHRERLHHLANDKTGASQHVLRPVNGTGLAVTETHSLKTLGEYYMNAKLAGGPWQCDQGDGTCDEMSAEIDFAPKDPATESKKHKYILDTDGNAWSSRFQRVIESHNMVIKASIFPEWNTHQLPEWYAYAPTKMDYSDLYSIVSFFRGGLDGTGGHDEVARRIARNGQCWAKKTWRTEDQQIYMYRLYLEYARLMSPDRDTGKMDFVLPSARSKRIPRV